MLNATLKAAAEKRKSVDAAGRGRRKGSIGSELSGVTLLNDEEERGGKDRLLTKLVGKRSVN